MNCKVLSLAVLFRSLLYSGFRDAGGHAIKSRNNVCVGGISKGSHYIGREEPLGKGQEKWMDISV